MANTVNSSGPSPQAQSVSYESFVEGTVSDLKSEIRDEDLSIEDLKQIKGLEEQKKSRKTALRFIDEKLREKENEKSRTPASEQSVEEVAELERDLENKIDEIEDKLEQSEVIEGHSDRNSIEIGTLKLQIYQGDPIIVLDRGEEVIELKHYHLIDLIRGNISEDLPGGFDLEENSDDRVKEENRSQNSGENRTQPTSTPENYSEEPKEKNSEPSEKERITEELKDEYDIEEERLENKDIEELNELKEQVGKEHEKRLQILEEHEEVTRDQLEDKNFEQLQKFEENLDNRKDLENKLEAYGYSVEKLQEMDRDSLEDKISEIEKKEEILEELDTDLEKPEIKEIKLDELRRLKREKKKREKLMDELEEQGLDRSNLEDSSTEDLRKLSMELKQKEEDSSKDKSVKEMEQQASDDLELLKGAKPESKDNSNSSDDDSKGIRDRAVSKVNKWKKEFSDVRSSDTEEKSEEEIRKEKLLNLLEDYRKLDNNVEKSVKTAQVMKGFIEHSLNIRKELTYREVSERLTELGQEENDEGLMKLARFFSNVHEQIYSGNVYIQNINEILDISKRVVSDL